LHKSHKQTKAANITINDIMPDAQLTMESIQAVASKLRDCYNRTNTLRKKLANVNWPAIAV